MEPFIDVIATDEWQKAKNAYQKFKQKLSDHAEKEETLRREVDQAVESLSDAEVAFELDEISKKEFKKIKKDHDKAQQALIEHCKRAEPLQKAVDKMEQKFAQVRSEQIDKAYPKVQKEYLKRLKKLSDAIDGLEEAIENIDDLKQGLHRDLIAGHRCRLKFGRILTQPGGMALKRFQTNINDKLPNNE